MRWIMSFETLLAKHRTFAAWCISPKDCSIYYFLFTFLYLFIFMYFIYMHIYVLDICFIRGVFTYLLTYFCGILFLFVVSDNSYIEVMCLYSETDEKQSFCILYCNCNRWICIEQECAMQWRLPQCHAWPVFLPMVTVIHCQMNVLPRK